MVWDPDIWAACTWARTHECSYYGDAAAVGSQRKSCCRVLSCSFTLACAASARGAYAACTPLVTIIDTWAVRCLSLRQGFIRVYTVCRCHAVRCRDCARPARTRWHGHLKKKGPFLGHHDARAVSTPRPAGPKWGPPGGPHFFPGLRLVPLQELHLLAVRPQRCTLALLPRARRRARPLRANRRRHGGGRARAAALELSGHTRARASSGEKHGVTDA